MNTGVLLVCVRVLNSSLKIMQISLCNVLKVTVVFSTVCNAAAAFQTCPSPVLYQS